MINSVAPAIDVDINGNINTIEYVRSLNRNYLKKILKTKKDVNDNPFLYSIHNNNFEIYDFLCDNKYINYNKAFIYSCAVSSGNFILMLIDISNKIFPFKEGFIIACAYSNISVMEILYNHDKNLLCKYSFNILLKNSYKDAISWSLKKKPELLNSSTIRNIKSKNLTTDVIRILYNENPKKMLDIYWDISTSKEHKLSISNIMIKLFGKNIQFFDNLKCPTCFSKINGIYKIYNIINAECTVCFNEYSTNSTNSTNSTDVIPYTLRPCNHMFCLDCIKLFS